ncbi:MAG: membrane dipeptidase [Prevotella sp.]|nr:membrane dipeptidase [Prevotella sp.]
MINSPLSRPVVGITSNYVDGDATLRERYYKQVEAAGGTPVIIPPLKNEEVIATTLDHIDALLLTGGGDIDPRLSGEEPSPLLGEINEERDIPELTITRMAFQRQMPIMGICRGVQTIVTALGGHVAQDISLVEGWKSTMGIVHSQKEEREVKTHEVRIVDGTVLRSIYPQEKLLVNSFHHQAVDDCGKHLRVSAVSEDGLVEAVESCEWKSVLGVQWHPEWLGEEGRRLFEWLVERAKIFSEASRLHDNIISLDSHCDTPMFFSQNIDFGSRDSRILVDLPKMKDGRLDATTMVCYLPQPKAGETFQEKVPFSVDGPKAYADLIFDKIETIVEKYSERVAFARCREDVIKNKLAGKKSIMIGIENGLAIEDDISNVEHFAQRGIVYITLCHNGDNQICDSARGSNTHSGVSEFGAKVIREMNRLGVAVDLSHGAESSFYDALAISSEPIVCSHSCCRSLCDVPRNLTDDQMRALAQKDGVMQITLYHGFLRDPGEASIIDAIEHLNHAIDVMGVDHVGLGSDFDGDGGVAGIADASEMINFTIKLLEQRFSHSDIRKIWGENWLRVIRR